MLLLKKFEFCWFYAILKFSIKAVMSQNPQIPTTNKLVKTLTDAATVTGLAAGIGFLAKKVINESMTSDPSSNLMNYVKFTVVIAASLATKDYLEKQKVLPS